MASKLKLSNANGKIVMIENNDSNMSDVTLNGASITKKVDTLANMRAMNELPETVWCSGYHSKNDGAFGSHFYRLKGLKTTETDNSGTVIVVSVGGSDYVYELQFDGAINVKWFGAKGDGITDDSVAIQKAVDTQNNVDLNWGTYSKTVAIAPYSNQRIFNGSFTHPNNNFANCFSIVGLDNVVIENVTIFGASAGNSIEIGINLVDSRNILINNVNIFNIGNSADTTSLERGYGIHMNSSYEDGHPQDYPPVSETSGCRYITVTNCFFKNIKGWGNRAGDFIYMRSSEDIITSSNHMDTCQRMGIAMTDNVHRVTIDSNSISNVSLAGIDLEQNYPDYRSISDIVISNNNIDNFGIKPSGQIGNQFYGIDLHNNAESVTISGNTIRARDEQSLSCIHAMNWANGFIISSNILECSGYCNGISLNEGAGTNRMLIENNIINNFIYGIIGYNSKDFNISNNNLVSTSENTKIAINLTGYDKLSPFGTISGNTIDLAHSTSAVYISYPYIVTLDNNNILIKEGNGIHIYSTNSRITKKLNVINNSFLDMSGTSSVDNFFKTELLSSSTISDLNVNNNYGLEESIFNPYNVSCSKNKVLQHGVPVSLFTIVKSSTASAGSAMSMNGNLIVSIASWTDGISGAYTIPISIGTISMGNLTIATGTPVFLGIGNIPTSIAIVGINASNTTIELQITVSRAFGLSGKVRASLSLTDVLFTNGQEYIPYVIAI